MLSVIIPTLDAASGLHRSLPPLVGPAVDGLVREVIVADGGSTDATLAIAEEAGARIVTAAKGRSIQLRAGVADARQPWVLFLHADTALEEGWANEAYAFMKQGSGRAAAFRFAFDDRSLMARNVNFWVGLRCSLMALPYGDQGLLIPRAFYEELGGYADLPFMEDVDLVRRIGRNRLHMLRSRAVTSAEKYRRDGYLRRTSQNLWLLARYLAGADPRRLAKLYA